MTETHVSARRRAWQFPVPVRPSRFLASAERHRQFNVEVAQDLIVPYCFVPRNSSALLLYDLQTEVYGGMRGQHGSGRSGVYRGRYLKGIGRTPAAANWNDDSDIKHGSGHMSIGSALRERLITIALTARGLGSTIVPCEGVLIGSLSRRESREVRRCMTSSQPHATPADARMIAMTVKPADFARPSNIVFALNQFESTPRYLGQLFLDLERHLRPPEERDGIEGSPLGIARALDAAFRRGLERFRAYARAGLFWVSVHGNFTLDGRMVDLESPLFFGVPVVGTVTQYAMGTTRRDLLGFEEFEFVLSWRLFAAWLKSRLRLLSAREIHAGRATRLFVTELHREVSSCFSRRHILYDDSALIARAATTLGRALAVGRRRFPQLVKLARHKFRSTVHGALEPIPEIGFEPLSFDPAPASPRRRCFEAATFGAAELSPDAVAYAEAIERLGSVVDPKALARELARIDEFAASGVRAQART